MENYNDCCSLNWIGIIANNAWVVIKYIWGVASTWFKETVLDPIANVFNVVWLAISSAVSAVWYAIKGVWEVAATWFDDAILSPVRDAFEDAWNFISDAAERAFEGITGVIKGIINGIIGMLNSALRFVFDGVNTIIEKVNAVGSILPGWTTIPTIKVPQIPYLATGAVFQPMRLLPPF